MSKIYSIGLIVIFILGMSSAGYLMVAKKGVEVPIGPAQNENIGKNKIRIVAFGDSLTAGYGLPISQAYPDVLQQALAARGHDVEVINSGVSGETSAGGVRRTGFILSLKPEIILFGLGGNDALRFLPPEELENNLDTALRDLLSGPDAPQILLLGMRAPGNADAQYRKAFDAVYPRMAEKYALPLVPFFLEGVALDPQYTLSDGIHPNAEGYRYIVNNNVLPRVESILPLGDNSE